MNEQLDQILGVLAGLAVMLASAGLALQIEHARLNARLRVFVGAGPAAAGRTTAKDLQTARSDRRRLFPGWARLGAEPLELIHAGLALSPRRFLGLHVAAILLGAGLARLAAARSGSEGAELLLIVAAGIVGGRWLPRAVLALRRGRRLDRIERQFPVAVDALANALQAGLSLTQALEKLGRDMPPPLGPELSQVFRELGVGLPLAEALDRLAERVPLGEVEIFVAAIQIQHRTGGNLSQILRGIAETIRQRLRIRGEIKVLTAQARLSAFIVSGLPFVVALAIKFVNPRYFDLILEPGTMRMLLMGAGLAILGGFYVMRRIADIEV